MNKAFFWDRLVKIMSLDDTLTNIQIAEKLNKNYSTISSTMSRLFKLGYLEKVSFSRRSIVWKRTDKIFVPKKVYTRESNKTPKINLSELCLKKMLFICNYLALHDKTFTRKELCKAWESYNNYPSEIYDEILSSEKLGIINSDFIDFKTKCYSYNNNFNKVKVTLIRQKIKIGEFIINDESIRSFI